MRSYLMGGAKVWVLFIAVGLFAGCSGGTTLQEAKTAQGSGKTQEFKVPFQQIWETIPPAVERTGSVVVETNQVEGYFLAQDPPSFFNSGENIVIYVKDVGNGRTLVEVISRKASSSMFSSNSEESILQSLSIKLWDRYGGIPDSAIK